MQRENPSGVPQRHSAPPVLDMTPEGEFRDPAPATWLDRTLATVGSAALLVTLIAGGILMISVALFFVSLMLPIVLGAGAIAAVSIWWRMRRLRQAGVASNIRFTVMRR
jgi:hypothetical protein